MALRNIHDAIGYWHDSDLDTPLHKYLGMSLDEYARWLEGRMTTEHLKALGYIDDVVL